MNAAAMKRMAGLGEDRDSLYIQALLAPVKDWDVIDSWPYRSKAMNIERVLEQADLSADLRGRLEAQRAKLVARAQEIEKQDHDVLKGGLKLRKQARRSR